MKLLMGDEVWKGGSLMGDWVGSDKIWENVWFEFWV